MGKSNETHIKFRNQIKHFLEGYIEILLDELEKEKIITASQIQETGVKLYKLQSGEIIDSSSSPHRKNNIELLFELKEIASFIYFHLDLQNADIARDMKFVQLMAKFEEFGAISVPWKTDKKLVDTLNNLNVLLEDENLLPETEKTIAESKINPSKLLYLLLEYYGREKAKNFFLDFGFTENRIKRNKEIDLILDHNRNNTPSILFEFKFRRNQIMPGKKMLLQAIQTLTNFSNQNQTPYFFLVVFTTQNKSRFEKEVFLFNRLLNEDNNLKQYSDKIIFSPISVKHLNLIEENYANFKNKTIEEDLRFTFREQPTSKHYPDRNDHYFTDTFDFKRNSFQIKISPRSTKHWRFGFRFSATDTFPSMNESRHNKENKIVDVHISVGDLEGRNWVNPEHLYLTYYEWKKEHIESTFKDRQDYNGDPIIMNLLSNDDGSRVEIEVRTENESFGSRIFDLSKFKNCQFGAWCDYALFNIHADIKVIRKGEYYQDKFKD